MKKATYHKPQVKIIEISTSHMLSSSIYIDGSEMNTGGRAKEHRQHAWGDLWEEEH